MRGGGVAAWRLAVPGICAHRGGLGEGPENTLYGMLVGLASGATHLEVDVRSTKDIIPVCMHDGSADRTCRAHGKLGEMTLREVRALDPCADWPAFRGIATGSVEPPAGIPAEHFRVPTLDDVLRTFPGVPLMLDLKDTAPPESVANVVSVWNRTNDLLLQGYDDAVLEAVAARLPDVPRGAGRAGTQAFYEGEDVDADAIVVPRTYEGIDMIDVEVIERAHETGKAYWVWTVNDEADAKALFEMGVDGIITDVPGKLGRVRRERLVGKRVG